MANSLLGNIESITGNVTVVHQDGTSELLTLDTPVYAADVVSVGKNAHVRIQLNDGSTLELEAGQTAFMDPDLAGGDGGYPAFIDDGGGLVSVSAIGVVTSVHGNVQVIRDGQVLTLKAGDYLLVGDVLKTGTDSTATVKVLDGSSIDIGPDFLASLDDQLSSSKYEGLPGQGQDYAAAILAGQDPSTVLPAPGAGESGNEGGEAIIIAPSGRAVTPESGHDTHGQELPFRIPEEELLQSPVDAQPNALDDIFDTYEDSVLAGNVSINDDAGDAPASFEVAIGPDNGVLEFNPDGTFIYTPDPDYTGTDSFTYVVTDADGDQDTATVNIQVNAVNDGPVAVDDALSTAEDTALTIGVDDLFGADGTGPANDYDLDSANFSSITVTGLASNGTLYLDGVAVVQGQEILVSEIASGKLSFEPAADFNGDAAFRYTVSDGVLSSGEATVTIAVNAVNDGPVAVDDALSTAEDTALTIGVDDLFGADGTGPANDYDLDSANFSSITVTGLASNGTLYLDGVAVVQGQEILVSEIASGKLSFEPAADFNGDAAFRYTVSDGVLSSGEATVTIAVNAVNDFPSAGVVSILVDEDGLLSGNHDAAYGDDVAVDDQGTPLAIETIATGTLDFSYGPEGPGDIDFTALDGTTAGFTSGGAAVTYSWDGNTHTLTAATSTATVFELVLAVDGLANPSGGYTFTLLGPVDHGDSGTEDNITVTLPFAVTDSDSDIASGSINVSIDDDMPVLSIADHGIIRNHDSSAVNSVSASITGDLGIDAGADGIGSLVIDFAGAHINGEILSQLTSSGSQVAVVSDGNGGLVGKLGDGTDIFTLTANPDGTYTFNLLGHLDVYSQQEFTLDSRSIAGGPADVLYLNTDAGIKMNVEGSSWVARVTGSDRLNPGGSGIGVRDNNFSDGDSITIDLDDENADPAAAATDIVASMKLGFKDFTAADTGGVGWTALWVAAAGDATPVATTSGTLYFSDGVLNSAGALEFAIGPNNGYTLDSIQITAADGTQVKLSTVTLFSANETGTATLDFNYTATDGDGDASTGSFSVVVDGGGGTGTVNGTTGDDVIGGSVQADILAGGDGDDILVGGGGDDILVGGAGNDQLLGGPGGDVMTGGTGSDTFIWQSGESGTDTITDFNPGEGDVLNIADLLVGVNNPSAGELDGSYMSIASGANTTITIFGDSGNADQVIQLTGYDTTGLSGVEILNNLLAGSNLVVE